ncbi:MULTISPECIES: site-specific integrase [Enterococcus]
MVFDYGCSIGILKENPMKKVILPTIKDDFKPNESENFYDRQQLLDFLNRMEEGFPFIRYTFFSLLAFTGVRKGEALVLTWRDIDFKKKTISVTKTQAVGKNGKLLVQTPKTKASNRVVSIDDHTLDILKE